MGKYKKSDAAMILSQFETLASKLGIKLRYENLKDPDFRIEGGACRIGDDQHIIIHSKLEDEDKIDIIAEELRKLSLEDVFIPPILRTVLFGDEEAPLLGDSED